jgi:hypothetical protein
LEAAIGAPPQRRKTCNLGACGFVAVKALVDLAHGCELFDPTGRACGHGRGPVDLVAPTDALSPSECLWPSAEVRVEADQPRLEGTVAMTRR